MRPFVLLGKSLLNLLIRAFLYFILPSLVARTLYRVKLHPLASVPGPRLAAVTSLWYIYHVRNGQMFNLAKTLHKRYGPAVRVRPNEVWFDSEEAFKVIYSKTCRPSRAIWEVVSDVSPRPRWRI